MGDPVAALLYRLPPLFRICIVLLGAISIHLTIGTYHTFGNMLPYMASYMRNYTDPTVRIEHLMWIPTFQGCFPFAMVIGGFMILNFGPRTTAIFGCSLTSLSVWLTSYSIRHSFGLFFVTYGLMFGLGMGVAYVTAVTSAINWAPDKVGLISGIVAAGFGLSSSIFAPLQTTLVNPHNLSPTRDGYFLQSELLERVPHLFTTLAIIYTIMQLLGLVVICDPPQKIHHSGLGSISDYWMGARPLSRSGSRGDRFANVSYRPLRETDQRVVKIESTVHRRSSSRGSEDTDSENDEVFQENDRETLTQHSEERSMRPGEMLQSSTFYFLFAALFCCSFYANMFYNLYKTYAETFIEDDFFLALAFSLGTVANALSRVAWGYLTDKTSFQITVSCATCVASALLLSMPLSQDVGRIMYLIWLVGIFICMGATHALFITATVRCFGPKFKATNYGLLTFSTTLSGCLLSILSQFYLKAIGYTWLFLITATFPFTAFIITATIHVTRHGKFICGRST